MAEGTPLETSLGLSPISIDYLGGLSPISIDCLGGLSPKSID